MASNTVMFQSAIHAFSVIVSAITDSLQVHVNPNFPRAFSRSSLQTQRPDQARLLPQG